MNIRHSRWFKPVVALGIVAAVTIGSYVTLSNDFFFTTQLRLADSLFPGAPADPRIVVVAIDDESVAEVGRWPWSRGVHADLIDAVTADGAALIGYDVTFGNPALDDSAGDQRMAEAMAAAGNVVLIGNFEFGARPTDVDALLVASEWFPPIPEFAAVAAGVGHANTRPDTDGVVRALPPVAEAPDGSLVPSLSFALAQLATGQSGPVTLRPGGIQVGGLLVPTGDLRLLDLNFA